MAKLGDPGWANSVQITDVYLLPVIDVLDRVEGLILCETTLPSRFARLGVFEISNGNPHAGSGADLNVKSPIQQNWDDFKVVMKGDGNISKFEEQLDHVNAYWFASDYTYTMNII